MVAVVWRTRDRLGREVVLTEAGLAHILAKHGDLVGRLDDIRATIEAPDFVNRDARHAYRENHYRRPAPGEPRIKVVVHYRPLPPQGTWRGEVITAHQARQIGAREEQLWP